MNLILTITDNNNYGNRLQNYAVQLILSRYLSDPKTIWLRDKEKSLIKNMIKRHLFFVPKYQRTKHFTDFTDKYIDRYFVDSYENIEDSLVNKIIIGSDQIWNLKWQDYRNRFLLSISYEKKIAFSASFGVEKVSDVNKELYQPVLNGIKCISVREESGREIVKEITGREDAISILDPTLLIDSDEWDKMSRKPFYHFSKNYILLYFLGDIDSQCMVEIERISEENNAEIINIMDKNSKYFGCGPREFLYLEKHAFLVCTDSFHSSVFAIIYNVPFVVFKRQDAKEDDMYCRIENLIKKLQLENRVYDGVKINEDNLRHDYTQAYKNIEFEKCKAESFLKKALED